MSARCLLVSVLTLAVLSLPGDGIANDRTAITSGALVGTWTLVSFEERRSHGETIYPMGPRPRGILIYDQAGTMSVQLMRDPSLRPLSADPRDSYYAYFGRYDVRAQEAAVVHHVEGSMRPGEIGVDYTRSVRLRGDRLILGVSTTRTLTWQRIQQRSPRPVGGIQE
jgi:hypothetical protein